MPFHRGDCLLLPTGGQRHLAVLLNDPVHSAEHGWPAVLVVNFSSVRDHTHDPACVVDAGCHPFIEHASFFVYAYAVVSSADRLRMLLDEGEIQARPPVSAQLFERIRLGLARSAHLAPRIRRFIRTCVPDLI